MRPRSRRFGAKPRGTLARQPRRRGDSGALPGGAALVLGLEVLIADVFRGAFGPNAKPSTALLIMYRLNVYPE